ncbi:MAG TPA: hypothetical protein VK395_27795 [Gemmataceae bacterium]|nr:hypothetical protein [Gemmataceae bacterium]
MAANKGGDSKQGLIIALVCFVLLSITLGVFTYYGYADQANLQASEKKAKEEKTTIEKDRDWYKYQALQLKAYTGTLPKDEQGDLPVLRDKNTSGPGKDAFAESVKSLDAEMGWDQKLGKPATTYKETVEKLRADLANAQSTLQKSEDQNKKIKETFDNMVATSRAEVDELKKKLELAQKDNLDNQQKMAKDMEEKLAIFDELSKKNAELNKNNQTDVDTRDKAIKGLKNQIKSLEKRQEKMAQQMTPPDLLKYDTPKGKIVRVDSKGELAWVNIGSADNVKPHQNLTFSIFGSGSDSRERRERKGALEIVDVLSAHLSTAKITEVADPNSSPLLPGDLLINPAWSPSNRIHVAIAGLIDLTGEGRDNIEEFMRNLKREGIVVDAYFDWKDMSIKGEGMTHQTDYLIRGEGPKLEYGSTIREGDTRMSRKTEIGQKIAEMETQANQLGATVVPLRRFVALTGYKLPKGAGVLGGSGYEFIRPQEIAPVEPKEKPEKKEPDGKDDKEKKDDTDK